MAWVYLPDQRTALASAQAEVALIWASCLQNPDSTPVALSSGRNIPEAQSLPPSGPDTSPQPRSGTTLPHSTPSPLPEQSTPSLPDTPASRSAWPENALARTTQGTSGPTSPEWPENLATGLDGSSSKTSPATSPLALKPCCEKYETWVSRLRLAYSQRVKLARRMKGSAGSALPIARGEDSESSGMRHSRGVADTLTAVAGLWPTPDTPSGGRTLPTGTTPTGTTPDGRKVTVGLENAVDLWMTPRTVAGGYTRDQGKKGQERLTLEGQGAQWPTASASMATGAGSEGRAGGLNLQTAADKWPTPASRDHKGENGPDHLTNGTGRLHLDQLPNAVAFLYSRPDQVTGTHGPLSWPQTLIVRHLLRAGMSLPPRSISRPFCPPTRRKPSNPAFAAYREAQAWQRWEAKRRHWWTKRRLSPAFVTWLMGWPTGHALYACSETEFSHWRQHMRGALSQLPTAYGPWIWQPPIETPQMTQLDLFGEV